MNIEITNKALYHSLNIIEVDVHIETELSDFPEEPYGFIGTVIINTNERGINIYGEHGFNDYQSQYGFVIKP